MNQTDKMQKKNRIWYILLVAVIMIQVAFITYTFATQKNGFHSDESWSYGFANSYRMPYLYKEGNSNSRIIEKLTNFGQWISGDVFRDYLTVNRGERFAYASVYYNKMYDQSPPLYCMLLHTVCSLFPETYSLWFGFLVNILLFIPIQICIFILAERISNSKTLALFACAFYGFTTAALGTVVYLRMYALLTCLTLLYLVLLQRMYQKQFRKITKEGIALAVCMILGGFTQYFFYVFAFFMTAFLCLFLLIKRQWKSLAAYAGISLSGALLGVLAYPTCIKVILNSNDMYAHSINLPFWFDVEYCLDSLSLNTLGIGWYIDRFVIAECLIYVMVAFLFVAFLFFLFRKETWFVKIYDKTMQRLRLIKQNGKEHLKTRLKNADWFLIGMVFAVFAALVVISRTIDVWGMQTWIDRYLFFLMPIWIIAVVYGMYCFLTWSVGLITGRMAANDAEKKRNKIMNAITYGALVIAALVVLLLPGQIGRSHYLFAEYDTDRLTDLTENADCIVVSNADWSIEWYCAELYKAANVYMIYVKDLENQMSHLNKKTSDGRDVYLIMAKNSFMDKKTEEKEEEGADADASAWMSRSSLDMFEKDFVDYFLNTYDYADKADYLYDQMSIAGDLSVYKLK